MTADVVADCRQAIEAARHENGVALQRGAGEAVDTLHTRRVLAMRNNAALDAFTKILDRHKPKRDDPMSMVQHTYCGCGAMEPFMDTDGLMSIGPVPFPCTTVLAVMAALGVGQETP